MADNLIIKIDGDASGFEKELNNAKGTGTRVFQDAGREGESAMNKVASAAGKIGAALAASKIVKEFIDIGKEAVKLASDLEEVQNVVDTTFGDGAGTIDQFAKAAAENYGISELGAKKMAGTMGAMLKSMDVEEIEDKSTSLVGLAGDMASFYNLDVEDAFAKLRAGISGETEPLKQLGINLNVANLEAYAMSEGITTAYKDMDQAQQATLRYNYIMNATADAQGDFAKTSDSLANQMRLVELNTQNLKTELGEQLLPVVTDVVTKFNDILVKAQEVFPSVQETISGFVNNVKEFFDDFDLGSKITTSLTEAQTQMTPMVESIKTTISGIFSSPEMEQLKSTLGEVFSNILEQVGPMFENLRKEVELILPQIQNLWSVVGPILIGFVSMIDDIVAAVVAAKTMIVNVMTGVYQLLKGVFDLIVGLVTMDKDRIVNAFKSMKEAVMNIFKSLIEGVKTIWSRLWQAIRDFMKNTLDKWLKGIIDGIQNKIYEAIDGIVSKLPGFVKDILHIDDNWTVRPKVEPEVEEPEESLELDVDLNLDETKEELTIDVPEVDTTEFDALETSFNELTTGMDESVTDMVGSYEELKTEMATSSADMMAKYDEVLAATGATPDESGMTPAQLATYSDGVSDEAILSWEKLSTALTTIMTTLSGGEEGGGGLSTVLGGISDYLNNGIPQGIAATAASLTDTLPGAVAAAVEVLGAVTTGENGETQAGNGNTLYTALGEIKGVIEDIDVAIQAVCKGLSESIPTAVTAFKETAGIAVGVSENLAVAGFMIADAYSAAAAAVRDLIAALEELGGAGGSGGPSGTGTTGGSNGVFAAAHGGWVNGVGIVGENGPEVISTSRNMNVFTNQALQSAQNRINSVLARDYGLIPSGSHISNSNDNSQHFTTNFGNVYGGEGLRDVIEGVVNEVIGKELRLAS